MAGGGAVGELSSELRQASVEERGGEGQPGVAEAEDGREQEQPAIVKKKRAMCPACNRPLHNSCLCSSLPATKAFTSGGVWILQHPHEKKRPLATAPIIEKCLERCWVIPSRRFNPNHPLVHALLESSREEPCLPIVLLYPGPNAQLINDVVKSEAFQQSVLARKMSSGHVSTSLEAKTSGAESNTAPVLEGAADLTESEDAEVQRMLACDYILLVIDGTWLQAREMFAATYAFLPPHHVVVTLETTNDELTQELADQPRLRSEPSRGCMLTIEAVAAALRILEGPESGERVAQTLLEPLKLITAMQARWVPALQPGYNPERIKSRIHNKVPHRQRPAKTFHAETRAQRGWSKPEDKP